MSIAFVQSELKEENVIEGVFIDTTTGQPLLVGKEILTTAFIDKLGEMDVKIVKGMAAKPYLDRILTPEQRMARVKKKVAEKQLKPELPVIEQPKPKKPKWVIPKFVSSIVGDPKFMIFKQNECKRGN